MADEAPEPPATGGKVIAAGTANEADAKRDRLLVHGTAIAINGRGVLLRGKPGAGKSDLALRLLAFRPPLDFLDAGIKLICDDYVRLRAEANGRVVVQPGSDAIAGLIEVRGVGLFEVASAPEAPLVLIVDLVAESAAIARLPVWPACETVLGSEVETLAVNAFEPSAVLKIALAVVGQRISDR